jgi:hypothetical protein
MEEMEEAELKRREEGTNICLSSFLQRGKFLVPSTMREP